MNALRRIVESGIDINKVIESGNHKHSLLWDMLMTQYHSMHTVIIEAGIELTDDEIDEFKNLNHSTVEHRNQIMKYLIDNGADVNFVSFDCKILNIAINSNNLCIVKYLIENGADCKPIRETGLMANQMARILGYIEMAEYIESFEPVPVKGVHNIDY